MEGRVSLYILIAVLSHYVVSLVQVSLHYLVGHRPLGRMLHATHVGEHHARYPQERLVADHYGQEKDASRYYLVPAAFVIVGAWAVLPTDLFFIHLGILALSFAAHVYLHVQYHLVASWLSSFQWFRRRQALHLLHHRDMTKNFGLIDFVWDRLLGTYEAVPS